MCITEEEWGVRRRRRRGFIRIQRYYRGTQGLSGVVKVLLRCF
jgi:hypothetical protein